MPSTINAQHHQRRVADRLVLAPFLFSENTSTPQPDAFLVMLLNCLHVTGQVSGRSSHSQGNRRRSGYRWPIAPPPLA